MMMIHEKLIGGQFLLDFKNDRSGILQTAAAVTHPQHSLHYFHHSPSPPIPGVDIYSAYQQQLQQQMINSHMPTANPNEEPAGAATEVLDLSRRDSAETAPKTPSPYHTNSSLGSGTGSPVGSPTNSFLAHQQSQPKQLLPTNLLYAAQAQTAANLAALYPGLYYPAGVKQEPQTQLVTQAAAPAAANNSLLQTFTSATATSPKPNLCDPRSPQQTAGQSTAPITTTSTNISASLDTKNTRPFKAFPRDPLVIAANFAATDVLVQNTRVERYTEYRKRVLDQIRSSNGGSRTVTNPKMRRLNSSSGNIHEGSYNNSSENEERHHLEESSDCESNCDNDNQMASSNSKTHENSKSNNNSVSVSGGVIKDAAYYERRRKNNAAAKKSRDRRRIKEDEIAIRAAYLERENIELRCLVDSLNAQVAALTSRAT